MKARSGLSLLDLLVAVVLVGILSTVLLTAGSGLIQQSMSDEEAFFGRLMLDELEHRSRARARSQGRSNWGAITATLPGTITPPVNADGQPFPGNFDGWRQVIDSATYVDLVADTLFAPGAGVVTGMVRVEGHVERDARTIAERTWLVYRPAQ